MLSENTFSDGRWALPLPSVNATKEADRRVPPLRLRLGCGHLAVEGGHCFRGRESLGQPTVARGKPESCRFCATHRGHGLNGPKDTYGHLAPWL